MSAFLCYLKPKFPMVVRPLVISKKLPYLEVRVFLA